jgi:hypothetical protein
VCLSLFHSNYILFFSFFLFFFFQPFLPLQNHDRSNLAAGRNSAVSVYQSVTNYYYTRGRILRKLQKNAGIEDYGKSCVAVDAKQWIEASQIVADLRSIYLMLADKLFKNWKYVERPKGTKSERKARAEFYM